MAAVARNLVGKVAVVTASTEGIGLAIATRLGQAGAQVLISSRKDDKVRRTVDQLRQQGITCDGTVCHVSKAEDRSQLFKKATSAFGGVDILVSNAAANPAYHPMLDTTEQTWDKIFDTNVKATFMLIKEAVPLMEARGGGSICIVASIAGYNAFDMIGAYSVSKTTLLGLTKALCPELAAKSIRINSIAPGVVKTRFSSALWKDDAVAEVASARIPLGRFAEARECAGLVAFLASDEASYITGENFPIAGGMPSRL